MSDPLRTDGPRAPDAASEVDRDAKIEQLLLIGLDHYFAAQYDDAINVWTRALFLDRSHPRARAYIERARSALAERQRESEELLQNALAAFQRGESLVARRLLQAAIEGGAPPDEALTLLDRLNRLDNSAAAAPARSIHSKRRASATRASETTSAVRLAVSAAVLATIVAAAGIASLNRVGWRPLLGWRPSLVSQEVPAASAGPPVPRDAELPLPRRGETALARARRLAANGRLRDALTALDSIRLTDLQHAEASRLRADIQRQLLGLAAGIAPETAVRDKGAGRLP